MGTKTEIRKNEIRFVKTNLSSSAYFRIFRKSPGHEGDGVGTLLELDFILAMLHHGHLLDQQLVRNVVKESVSGQENNVTILDTELVLVSWLGSICQYLTEQSFDNIILIIFLSEVIYLTLKLCWRKGQLEWSVKIMLLFMWPENKIFIFC